jgi:hypothetical protein
MFGMQEENVWQADKTKRPQNETMMQDESGT